MKPSVRILLLAASGLVLGLFAACSTTPTPSRYTVNFTLDKALEGTSLQVDVIGANAVADLPKWQAYSITEYWQPGNTTRRDADKATALLATHIRKTLEAVRELPDAVINAGTVPLAPVR